MLKMDGEAVFLTLTMLPPSVAMMTALMLQISLSKASSSSALLGKPDKTNLLQSSCPDQMIGLIKAWYMSRV